MDDIATPVRFTTQHSWLTLYMNKTNPTMTRCDGRKYLTALDFAMATVTYIHPPMNVTTIQPLWSSWPATGSCLSLNTAQCAQASKAFEAETSKVLSSVWAKYAPHVTAVSDFDSVPEYVVVPNRGGLWSSSGRSGGLPPYFNFEGALNDPVCHGLAAPGRGECPEDIHDCLLDIPIARVYFWPTSSAGDYCGSRNRVPVPQTVLGVENTAVIRAYVGDNVVTTTITSPSALVVLPTVKRLVPMPTFLSGGIFKTIHGPCGTDYQTAVAMQLHPDDISSMYYVGRSRSDFTATYADGHHGGVMRDDEIWYSSQIDFAAVRNPAWAPGDAREFELTCWGALPESAKKSPFTSKTLENGAVITLPPCPSVMENSWQPKLRLPAPDKIAALLGNWANFKQPNRNTNTTKPKKNKAAPVCKVPDSSEGVGIVAYISITAATMTTDDKIKRYEGTITVTTSGPISTMNDSELEQFMRTQG
jgi:hypothetical protein